MDSPEIRESEVLQEDVVADNVCEGGRRFSRKRRGGGAEVGVGDGKDGEGSAAVKVGGDAGVSEEGGEFGEIWVLRENLGDVEGVDWEEEGEEEEVEECGEGIMGILR